MFHITFRCSLMWLFCLPFSFLFGQGATAAQNLMGKEFLLEDTPTVLSADMQQSGEVVISKPEVMRWKNRLPTHEETVYLCPGEPYIYQGTTYFAPTQITDTLSGATGDTLLVIHLIDLPIPTFTRNYTICKGDLLQIDGLFYDAAGVYADTIINGAANGCDSISIIVLEWGTQPTLQETIHFCPGESVVIGGKQYYLPGVVQLLLAADAGCDTFAVYTLVWLPEPTKNETIHFCQGESVVLGGQSFDAPGWVDLLLPSTTGGCDTIATFQLVMLPRPKTSATIRFCEGESIWLNGQTHTQSGVVQLYLPAATGGCDTLATFYLEKLPLPSRSQTILTCPGEPFSIGGNSYFAPDTVELFVAAQPPDVCDTLVRYILLDETAGQSSHLSLQCPADVRIVLPSDATETPVQFAPAVATSDCSCPGLRVEQLNGWPSGSNFPVGTTVINWRAEDACGSVKTCRFSIKIENETPCDEARLDCMTFELLSIRRDAQRNLVYRFRATNRCATPMTYLYVGLPQGIEAVAPGNHAIYDAPSGREYWVRQPNFSPVRSVRFKNLQPQQLVLGAADIFRVVLPATVNPPSIYVAARMANQQLDEWHLHTSNCPIGQETGNRSSDADAPDTFETTTAAIPEVMIYPNPAVAQSTLQVLGKKIADGAVFVLTDASGKQIYQTQVVDNQVSMLNNAPVVAGVYFYKIIERNALPITGKLILR